jgi:hypothetical protein
VSCAGKTNTQKLNQPRKRNSFSYDLLSTINDLHLEGVLPGKARRWKTNQPRKHSNPALVISLLVLVQFRCFSYSFVTQTLGIGAFDSIAEQRAYKGM